MRGDEIDEYIVAFEHLRLKTGWERGAHGTLEMFKKGLPRRLHWKNCNATLPRSRWTNGYRRLGAKIQRRLVLASLGPRNEHMMARRDCLKEALRRPPQRQPQRDPEATDVDAEILGDGSRNGTRERFGGMSEAERLKRSIQSSEGRCFGCGRQGHRKRDLPKSSERQKERKHENSDYGIARREGKSGRCNEEKKKRRTRFPSLRPRRLHSVRPDSNDEGTRRNVGQVDGNRRGFFIPPKVAATRRAGEINNTIVYWTNKWNDCTFCLQTLRNWADQKALLDCGASENFIDINTWKRLKIGRFKFAKQIPVHNIDRTMNFYGST